MFSDEDAREIYQLFSPPKHGWTPIPSLLVSSDGHGLITLQHLEANFKNRVRRETKRINVSTFAHELGVDQELVLQLVRIHHELVLLSADSSSIITKTERETIQEKLSNAIVKGMVFKSDFTRQNDVDPKSFSILLDGLEGQQMNFDDYVCSKVYEDELSDAISSLLKRSLDEIQSIDIVSKDLPCAPPTWFVLRVLEHVLDSQNLAGKVHVQESTDSVHCAPKQLIERKRDAVVENLQAGALAYLNLQAFWKDFPELYPSFPDAHTHFENLSDIQMMDSFAVSSVWMTKFEKECVKILEQDGCVDLRQHIATSFPDSLRGRVLHEVEHSVFVVFEQNPESKLYRVGNFLLTETRRDRERNVLFGYAEADAATQWQQQKNNPEKEIKFSLSNITAMITSEQPVLTALIKEKAVEKALDEQFWTAVSTQEAQNEAEFSAFWVERVVSRCRIYNDGLSSVEDQKLRDQLAELFATYAQKEVLSDCISKARSQGLVLSRKTRKNISRLETISKGSKMDTAAILAALDKFNKKQTIEVPDESRLDEVKKTMVGDMVRRMQKQKQSDGPVLFLTLVVILFATHYSGVVYATGKFAPKLLKQLKSSLEPEDYEQLEKWKEAAKGGTLSADDRQGMKKMAEA